MAWVQVFNEVSTWLLDQENDQERLLEILQKIGIAIPQDIRQEGGEREPMWEIDPFTFFRLILRFGNDNRTNYFRELLGIINPEYEFPEEMNYNGVPSVLPNAAWMSGEYWQRGEEANSVLWQLFREASNNQIENEVFVGALNINAVGKTKISQALFSVFPRYYFPIDSVTRPWLDRNQITIPMQDRDTENYLQEYERCIEDIKEKFPNREFSEISHEAFIQPLNNDGEELDLNLNTILYGPPGTGKTYSTSKKAVYIIDSNWCTKNNIDGETQLADKQVEKIKQKYDDFTNSGQIVFTTFHQSFSYEDFIQGISAKLDEDGNLRYEVNPGIFKKLCDKADENPDKKYVLIIDEINRGNISKIFGELITLLEKDKRKGAKNALAVKLPHSKDGDLFSIPSNVHVIGTMNTADKSLANMDLALRRRFDFEEIPPKYDLLDGRILEGVDIGQLLKTINQRIEVLIDRDHLIGHSYMLDVDSLDGLKKVFEKKIIPLLQEYFYDDWQRIRWVLNDHRKDQENQFIRKGGDQDTSTLFGLDVADKVTDRRFYINQEAFNKPESYQGILNNNE